jgi:hypothetical protein
MSPERDPSFARTNQCWPANQRKSWMAPNLGPQHVNGHARWTRVTHAKRDVKMAALEKGVQRETATAGEMGEAVVNNKRGPRAPRK